MKIVKITLYAQAYYSGAEHYEELYLPKEYFDKIEEYISEEISVGELDGKHSDVYGDVESEELKDGQYKPRNSDGENLYCELLEELEEDECKELDKQMKIAEDYLETLDREIKLNIVVNSKYKEEALIEIAKIERKYK